jgi:hypothetical protein
LSLRLLLATFATLAASRAAALDVVAMYRGSCQIDTGVVLRVDAKTVVYVDMKGLVKRIPRYEIVGIASYPLPDLPLPGLTVPPTVAAPAFEFKTFRHGDLAPLVKGWPIEYNAEHIQVLATDGRDHLVDRDDIWSVKRIVPAKARYRFKARGSDAAYKLRHPLAFESCPDNVTPGVGTPVPVIPQTTYDNPINIKRHHDHLREGIAKVEDYEDRQSFYAVPQYYGNRTRLGTWSIIGSRYSNVGSRQTNFLPLVENELSEGPFGYQRLVRSGVAPLAWSIHEEPIVQVYYGLKADYIHFEAFFDPTSPLIGAQYDYSKGQLNKVDERLIEKGGVEFGLDLGYFALAIAYSEGDMAIRAGDYFANQGWGLSRLGVHFQYNYWKAGFYAGNSTVELDDELQHGFTFVKLYGSGRIGPLAVKGQYISRTLSDTSGTTAAAHYDSRSDTLACQADWDVSYRWTIYGLVSLEKQAAAVSFPDGRSDGVDEIWPKLAGGATIAF